YFRQLAQPVLTLDLRAIFPDQRVGIDDVTGRQYLGHRCRCLALGRSLRRPRPSHAFQRDGAGLSRLADRAADFATRLEADPRRLIAGLQHHRHAPRRDVVERFDVGELDAPIARYIELADRTAPALRLVVI